MSNKLIINGKEASSGSNYANNVILEKSDGEETTVQEALNWAVNILSSAKFNRTNFRGRNLGHPSNAAEQLANGIDYFWLGDYWETSDNKYRIADFNYFLNTGDTNFTTPHLVIVPDKGMYSHVMNDTATTDGGYVGSKMYTDGLTQAKTTINGLFGNLVLPHREFLTNAVKNGKPSGVGWYDSTVEFLNEIMVFGSYVFSTANDGITIPCRYTIDNSQFALMATCSEFIKTRQSYWLRDAVSASAFSAVLSTGYIYDAGATSSYFVRPYFLLGISS